MQYGSPIVPVGDEIFTGGTTGPPIRLTSFRLRYGVDSGPTRHGVSFKCVNGRNLATCAGSDLV
ncbi:MAG: hypothetical protein CFH35_00743 [Alphaproteobacteria bacterium MarineAlpha9_Bin5]|jgi:hypothetical protein|nr:MAG: hypothetical protein CFH35_00743 [Alphaproteobacteria bacterium MarineAlpha9_Bin5]